MDRRERQLPSAPAIYLAAAWRPECLICVRLLPPSSTPWLAADRPAGLPRKPAPPALLGAHEPLGTEAAQQAGSPSWNSRTRAAEQTATAELPGKLASVALSSQAARAGIAGITCRARGSEREAASRQRRWVARLLRASAEKGPANSSRNTLPTILTPLPLQVKR